MQHQELVNHILIRGGSTGSKGHRISRIFEIVRTSYSQITFSSEEARQGQKVIELVAFLNLSKRPTRTKSHCAFSITVRSNVTEFRSYDQLEEAVSCKVQGLILQMQ